MSKKPKLWWLKLSTEDYAIRLMNWTPLARVLYLDLYVMQWNLGSIPADPKELMRLCRYTQRQFREAWKNVESEFPVCADGRRRNAALVAEYDHSITVSQSKSRSEPRTVPKHRYLRQIGDNS